MNQNTPQAAPSEAARELLRIGRLLDQINHIIQYSLKSPLGDTERQAALRLVREELRRMSAA